MGDPGTIATVATSAVVLVGAAWAVWRRWVRGPWRAILRFGKRLDQTINGREAEVDAWGRETRPPILPLAEQMTGIRETVDALVKSDERLNAVEKTVAGLVQGHTELTKRVSDVERLHQVERITGNVAQAKVIDAIAEANRNHGVVDEPDTEL